MKNLKSLLPFLFLFLLIACKKDKESPIACISGPDKVDRKQSVQYTWCGSWVTESEVHWTTSWGQTGTGTWFSPEFPGFGKYTITASGSNKNGSATKSLDVEYGIFTVAKVFVTNECFTGNTGITTANGYKAYLYNNLGDWSSDINSKTHSKAIDSANFNYSATYQTIVAEITTTATPGSKLYFSVESPGTSNYGDISYHIRYPNNDNYNGQLVMTEYSNNSVNTRVDDKSRKLFHGKWMLNSIVVNGNTSTPSVCNQDDFITFSPAGAWEYNIGTDNCSGTSMPSNGTYSYSFPICNTAYFNMSILSGPFTGTSIEFNDTEIKVNYTEGTNTGYFRFTYSNP